MGTVSKLIRIPSPARAKMATVKMVVHKPISDVKVGLHLQLRLMGIILLVCVYKLKYWTNAMSENHWSFYNSSCREHERLDHISRYGNYCKSEEEHWNFTYVRADELYFVMTDKANQSEASEWLNLYFGNPKAFPGQTWCANPSSKFWVWPRLSSQLVMAGKPLMGATWEASQITLASCFYKSFGL